MGVVSEGGERMTEQFEIIVAGKPYTVTCEHGNMLIDDGGDTLISFSTPNSHAELATLMVRMRMGYLASERAKASMPVEAWA